MRIGLIVGGLVFFLIVCSVLFLTKGENTAVLVPKPVTPPPAQVMDAGLTGAALEKEAGAMARRFLEAKTVEETLPLVRNPEIAKERMRRFYPDGRIQAPGLSIFNSTDGFFTEGKLHLFSVVTGDQAERKLPFVETKDGLKIDWEGWVGWSEIPWKDFLAGKPTASHVFRVFLAPVDYYNFAFADDTKWQCYRLEAPDREHAVYGYVERDSPLNQELRPGPDESVTTLTLSLKFPAGATADSQVLIEGVVCKGWIEKGDTP